jgi:hypothetical protein
MSVLIGLPIQETGHRDRVSIMCTMDALEGLTGG